MKNRGRPPKVKEEQVLVVDEYRSEKPLSELINDLRVVLKKHQHQCNITIREVNSKPFEVELTVRIQV